MGPAISSYKVFKECVESGMNAVRINMSHSTRDKHQKFVDYTLAARKELGCALPLIIDTRGPEVRVGNFDGGKVNIKRGQEFTFTTEQVIGNNTQVCLTEPSVISKLKSGSKILTCNGLLNFKVLNVSGGNAHCKALNSGTLSNHKSVFLPGVELDVPYLNDKDKDDIKWAIANNFEYIAASFVSTANDVIQLREFIKSNGGNIQIISKIESKLGLKNLDEIIKVSDGIMVARGDLGVEIPMQKLPSIQKDMITRSRLNGKVVVTATEMLESMINNPRPTRAETSDVANAVFDGTSVVMLSAETSVGAYPTKAIKTMAQICDTTEKSIKYNQLFGSSVYRASTIHDAISYSAVTTSFSTDAKVIAVFSGSGNSARLVSRFRPNSTIMAVTDNINTYHSLALSWGVLPVFNKATPASIDKMVTTSDKLAHDNKLVRTGDVMIITSASRHNEHTTDIVKAHIVN